MQYCKIIITLLLQKHLPKMRSWQCMYHPFPLMDDCCNEGAGKWKEAHCWTELSAGQPGIDLTIDSARTFLLFIFQTKSPPSSWQIRWPFISLLEILLNRGCWQRYAFAQSAFKKAWHESEQKSNCLPGIPTH